MCDGIAHPQVVGQLVLPAVLVVCGLRGFFALCDREEAAKTEGRTTMDFWDVLVMVVTLACLVGGVYWGLCVLGYESHGHMYGM